VEEVRRTKVSRDLNSRLQLTGITGLFGNLKQQMSSKLGREGSSAGESLGRLLPKIPAGSDNGLGVLRTPRVKTSPLDPNAQPTAESDIGL
jgi:hypothetical protein